jgi:hypothetical protein
MRIKCGDPLAQILESGSPDARYAHGGSNYARRSG